MTKKEKQQLTPDFNNKLLKGLYVHDLFELLEQVGGGEHMHKRHLYIWGTVRGNVKKLWTSNTKG